MAPGVALKYAEAQATDSVRAQKMAVQFAVGVLIKNPETQKRERIFVPPNCRLIAGSAPDNPICLDDESVSDHHCAFDADDEQVYVEDLGSSNCTFVSGKLVRGRRKLEGGDRIKVGGTEFEFHKLDRRN